MECGPLYSSGVNLLARVTLALCLALTACHTLTTTNQFELHTPTSAELNFAPVLYQGVGATLRPGHEIELVNNGAVFDTVVDEISKAKSSVNIVAYIWKAGVASDRVIAALKERMEAMVTCRVIVDAVGSPSFAADLEPLVKAGCDVRLFRPLPGVDVLARNHRKMVIVDGKRGVAGGFCIRDSWLGNGLKPDEWRDTNVRIAGPAVREMQQAFAANWLEAGGPPLPESDFPNIAPAGKMIAAYMPSTGAFVGTQAERLSQLAILSARKQLWISNAYFVPSGIIFKLLKKRAAEGVDVRILTAGSHSDSKASYVLQQGEYEGLIEAGVRVWEYEPAMIHSKTMLIDQRISTVGSINLDPLSLNKLEEGAVVVDDVAFAMQLEATFIDDCKHAKEITKVAAPVSR